MVVKFTCLFCKNGVDPTSRSNFNDEGYTDTSEVLRTIFQKLCRLLELKLPNILNSLEFQENPFPFCKMCRNDIAKLCKLHDQVSNLEQKMRKIMTKLSVLTIESEVKESGHEKPNAEGDMESEFSSLEQKYFNFRSAIIKRFGPRVLLKDCKNECLNSADANAKPEDLDVLNNGTCTQINETREEHAEGHDDGGFEPASPDGVDSGPPSPVGSIPDDIPKNHDSSATSGLLKEEDRSASATRPKEVLPSATKPPSQPITSGDNNNLRNDTLKFVPILPRQPVQIAKIKTENQNISGTPASVEQVSENESLQSNGMSSKRTNEKTYKIMSTSEKLPPSKVTWVEGKIFSYHSIRFTCGDDVIACLHCDYKCVPDGTIYGKIKAHILKSHIVRAKQGKVHLVDEITKTHIYDGFHFKTVENGYKCSSCDIICKFRGKRKFINIKNHIRLIHMEEEKSTCEICGDGKIRKNLSMHKRLMHSSESSKRVCEICGKEFKNQTYLNLHMDSHKDKSEYSHQCDNCGRTFRLKFQLEVHMKTHTGEKDFVCEKCGKGFKTKSHLITHIPTHDKIRPYACNQCEWSFGANFLLTRHIKQVHQGIKPPPPKKRKKIPDN